MKPGGAAACASKWCPLTKKPGSSKSVARHYNLDDRLTAIVDIGGGSAEVVLAAGGLLEQLQSLPLGAVRLTEQYVSPIR